MTSNSERQEARYNTQFIRRLGDGQDGIVLETATRQAVKFFVSAELFRRELSSYELLSDAQVRLLEGFAIPKLLRFDAELLAIEMSIVAPPFALDFASAYTLDEIEHFGFTDEVMLERETHWAEIFGDDWPRVQAFRDAFTRATDLVLLDLSRNNIKFE